MDKEFFVQNVKKLCLEKGIKPTNACKSCGIGGSFLSDINRGQTPSVSKVQSLAQYLGVTTSELLGEKIPNLTKEGEQNETESTLVSMFQELNQEGQEKVIAYTKDLVDTGNYKKDCSIRMDTKEA